MTWRTWLNNALRRTTGLQIIRVGASSVPNARPKATLAGKKAGNGAGNAAAKKAGNGAAKKAVMPAAEPTPAATPVKPAAAPTSQFDVDVDDVAKEIILAVRPWTMTSNDKLFGLIEAVRYVHRTGLPGDFVECGVWRGGSSQAAARAFAACGDTSRHLYLFDTYEGMPEPTEEDVRHDGKSAAEMLAAKARPKSGARDVWAYASIEDVQDGMSRLDYPADKVHLIKGDVALTIPGEAPEQISILRLDTDWYQSTKHELDHLYDRLVPGGVLILDDYGWWQGARQAVDEWLAATGEPILMNRLGEGRIAVKPRR